MWLSLVDYSHRFQVSLSTLRRKIKGNTIKFKLEGGRYFLWADESELGVATAEVSGVATMAEPSSSPDIYRNLLDEKEKRILLLEQHIRVLHQENEALQSLVKMLEGNA
jgi:hypothetical protein